MKLSIVVVTHRGGALLQRCLNHLEPQLRTGDDLVVVDPNTGNTSHRGEIGVEHVFGLGYADESLYGFTEEGEVLQISPSTGEVEMTNTLPGVWYGATTNPVVW